MIAVSRVAAVLAVAAAVGAGCASPSRTEDDYRRKAAHTVSQVSSAVETGRLAVRLAAEHRAQGPYLTVLVGDAEEDASAVEDTFLSVQPPSSTSDSIRERVAEALQTATDALAQARIAARRNDLDGLAQQEKPLAEASDQLSMIGDELR